MRNLKRALSLALASVMLLGMMVVGTSASYADVDAADNLEAISVLQMVGVMTGDENGNFNPDKNVTRNEMAVVMCNLLGLTPGGTTPFTDVPEWAQPYVAACYANGIIAGTSATTYGGNDNVTAVQAGLMVMKALGYFGYQGEFADDWKLAVVKQANKIDLYDGINAYTDKNMSRNEVAQMVLNSLECTIQVVEQVGGLSVEGNGISVTEKPTYRYTPAENKSAKDYANDGYTQYTMELCEKLYGEKLKKDTSAGVADDFGRPATKWTYGDKKVTCPDAATLTYTSTVKGETIYVDLGNINPDVVTIKENGATVTAGTGSVKSSFDIASGENGDNDKIGANGTVVEVYYDNSNPASTKATVVVTNTYVDVVTNCKALANGKYEITLKNEAKKYESAVAFEDDDVVLYTRKDSTYGSIDSIKSMALAEKFTGEVSHVKNADTFTVDGTTYKYSANFAANAIVAGNAKLTTASVESDVEAYVDAYGYVIAFGEVDETSDYAVVLGKSTGTYGDDYTAKLLFADGTVDSVNVKKASYGPLNVNDIVSYTVNSNDVYTLSVKASAGGTDITTKLAIEQGKAAVTINNTGFTADNKTVFFYYNEYDTEYSAYVGIDNVPDFANNSTIKYYFSTYTDGNLKAVYIKAEKDVSESNADDVIFLYSNGDEKLQKDADLGSYYEFKIVKDGEPSTLKVDTTTYSKVTGTKAGSLLKSVKYDTKGVATDVTVSGYTVNATTGDGQIKVTLGAAAKNGVIAGYRYASDVKVMKYNTTDGAFETKSIGALKAGNTIFAVVDDNVITTIYYIGA